MILELEIIKDLKMHHMPSTLSSRIIPQKGDISSIILVFFHLQLSAKVECICRSLQYAVDNYLRVRQLAYYQDLIHFHCD